MAGRHAGRAGVLWNRVKAQVFEEETDCWLCGQHVDQTIPANEPAGRTVDHLIQLCHGGPPHTRAWCRLAHRACNTARSNRLRGLDQSECACTDGLPCAVRVRADRGILDVDLTAV